MRSCTYTIHPYYVYITVNIVSITDSEADLKESVEAWVCPVTLGQGLLAHLKEVHKGRVHSQKVVSLYGQGEGGEEYGGEKRHQNE